MNAPQLEAQRWFRQARADLEVARTLTICLTGGLDYNARFATISLLKKPQDNLCR